MLLIDAREPEVRSLSQLQIKPVMYAFAEFLGGREFCQPI
jgi:hypothetical protein